jgi:hypothetical protein
LKLQNKGLNERREDRSVPIYTSKIPSRTSQSSEDELVLVTDAITVDTTMARNKSEYNRGDSKD